MKIKNKLFVLIVFAFLAACSQKEIYQTEWKKTDEPLKALPKNFDSKTNIAYGISNDQKYLYLNFVFVEENIQQQVMISGMQVWLDTTKKRRKNFGLFFPMRASRNSAPSEQRPQPENRTNQIGEQPSPADKINNRKERYLTTQKEYKTIGFNGYSNGLHKIAENEGITPSLSFNENGSMTYNTKIPLSCLYINSLSTIDSDNIFSLNVKIPGIQLPGSQGGPPSGGQGGPPGGGRGGRPGGGRGGHSGGSPAGPANGGSSAGRPDLSQLADDKELKIRFKFNFEN